VHAIIKIAIMSAQATAKILKPLSMSVQKNNYD